MHLGENTVRTIAMDGSLPSLCSRIYRGRFLIYPLLLFHYSLQLFPTRPAKQLNQFYHARKKKISPTNFFLTSGTLITRQ